MTPIDSKLLHEKYDRLLAVLRGMRSVVLAYSGGVDSTLLLRSLKDAGIKALAVIARSDVMADSEFCGAEKTVQALEVPYRIIMTSEMENPEFTSNPPSRCFFCKEELFTKLYRIADTEGYETVIDGTNSDDLADHRPGREAAMRLGVRSPLVEVSFTKAEIREMSRQLGLPTWSKPAAPCLASRFPHGIAITRDALTRVETAEALLLSLGFTDVRVRSHERGLARIEVKEDQVQLLARDNVRAQVIRRFRELGFRYITVDLEGFRSGSLNPVPEQ